MVVSMFQYCNQHSYIAFIQNNNNVIYEGRLSGIVSRSGSVIVAKDSVSFI